MKRFIIVLMSLLCCAGCLSGGAGQEGSFVYFNLSTNEVWVVNVAGLPEWASPGRLVPVKGEDQLSESSLTSFETVRVKDRIKIVWKDNGIRGWPGGLKTGELIPAGVTHEAEFSRDELGIPAKLRGEKVVFTYLGDDKWRVRLFKTP